MSRFGDLIGLNKTQKEDKVSETIQPKVAEEQKLEVVEEQQPEVVEQKKSLSSILKKTTISKK